MARQCCSIAQLADLDLGDLTSLWSNTFRCPPAPNIKRELLVRLLAYESQARAHGSLPRAVERRLDAFSGTGADGCAMGSPEQASPMLRLGARLVRSWNGVTHEVTVLERGFAYRGKQYRSLSEIAEAITGAHWSGPRFFGLKKVRSTRAGRGSA